MDPEALSLFEEKLGLPAGFTARRPRSSPAVRSLLDRLVAERGSGRNYAPGLWMAFICLAEEVLGATGRTSLKRALSVYPPLTLRAKKFTKTLTVTVDGKAMGIRKYVGLFQEVVWADLERLGFPNAPAHTTWSWGDYRTEIDSIFALTPAQRASLALAVWEVVRTYPKLDLSGSSVVERRPFEELLRDFGSEKGDPPGSVLQGLVYAYLRADAPDVTLETHKVGAGGARLGAVGDIDGRSGGELVSTVEVKDYAIEDRNLGEIAGFLRNRLRWPNATAIVVATHFTAEAISYLGERRVLTMTREHLLENVRVWDLRKQRLATRAFQYFVARVQRDPGLTLRLASFLRDRELAAG